MCFGFELHGLLRAIALIVFSVSLWFIAAPAQAEIVGPLPSADWTKDNRDSRENETEFSTDLSKHQLHSDLRSIRIAVLEGAALPHDRGYTPALRDISPGKLLNSNVVAFKVVKSDLKLSNDQETHADADRLTKIAFTGLGRDLTHLQIRPAAANTMPLPSAFWMLLLALFLTALIAHRGNQISR